MDRVFSVGDISDQFWSPPPIAEEQSSSSSASKTMNRSASEWAFQRYLQEASASESSSSKPVVESNKEDIVEIKNNDNPNPPSINNTASVAAGPPPNVPIDSDEYQAFLKSRLNLACAAVALTRASSAKPQDFAALPDNGSQASDTSQLGSQVHPRVSGHDLSKREYKDDGGPLGSPSLPGLQKKPAVQVKSTSGSSRDLSDDDELDGETETTQNMDPADSKRVRRMLSNRESARRSRRRKQAHLTELETQVSQLRVENSTLLKRLSDISHKHNEAAVDNRVLKADIETMRAKVKFAEEAVKRATGMNPFLQAMSEISTLGIPSFGGSPSDTSGDAAVPIQDDPNRLFYQPASDNHVRIPPVDNALQNPATAPVEGNRMERTASMQRVASLEHLQKRIRGDISSCGTQSSGENL